MESIEPVDRLIAGVQSGVVYTVVNFIGTGGEGRGRYRWQKRKQLAATLADKTPNTRERGTRTKGIKKIEARCERGAKKAETFSLLPPPPTPPPCFSVSRKNIAIRPLPPPPFPDNFYLSALYSRCVLAEYVESLNSRQSDYFHRK